MTGIRLGGREVGGDGRQFDIVLEGDLGWAVGQERIDRYGNVG